MAEASISVDQDQFSCPVCLDLLKDPVTINCGHNFCKKCINDHWNQEDQRKIYRCPQCRETFTQRPVLRRNNMLIELLEKLKKPATRLQEKICSQHDKLIEIYCRTDHKYICYLCTMDEHKGHDTVAAVLERSERQNKLKEIVTESQQRIQQKEKKLQEIKHAMKTFKLSAQSAVKDSESIFNQLISYFEKKRSEVTQLIRTQEKAELSRAEEVVEQLEEEIVELKRRKTELEQLSYTEDHISFLQSFQSLSVSSGSEKSPNITISQRLSFDKVKKTLSDLKKQLEEFCKEKLNTIPPQASAIQILFSGPKNRDYSLLSSVFQLLFSGPKTREDFLQQYFCHLTLDPNTARNDLVLSDNNRVVTARQNVQKYPDHPERFDHWCQILCKESLSGRCYWEVEWRAGVYISVSYKDIRRKGFSNECKFGHNTQSWSLDCSSSSSSSSSHSFYHNNIKTQISAPSSSRIGVYVDHSAGTLSFYSISDTMTLLHTVHTTFTQPLYAGFWIHCYESPVKLCDPN